MTTSGARSCSLCRPGAALVSGLALGLGLLAAGVWALALRQRQALWLLGGWVLAMTAGGLLWAAPDWQSTALPAIVPAWLIVGSGMRWVLDLPRPGPRLAALAMVVLLPVMSFAGHHWVGGRARAVRAFVGQYMESLDALLPGTPVVLAEGAWCTQGLFTKTPIHTLEDFKNKRLRVHNPQTAELVNALGGKPVPLALPEVMPSLERGVIDGLFTSSCYGNGQEYWRVAKNVQNWTLGPINGWAIIINADVWAKLPPDLQSKISAEMLALQKEALGSQPKFTEAAYDNMKKNGAILWVAPEAERKRLFDPKYVQPAYDAWIARAKEVGFDGQAYLVKVKGVLGR